MKMNETNKAEHVIMTLLSFKQQLVWERLKKEIVVEKHFVELCISVKSILNSQVLSDKKIVSLTFI